MELAGLPTTVGSWASVISRGGLTELNGDLMGLGSGTERRVHWRNNLPAKNLRFS
jgi:hypothetical protein